MRSFGPAQFVIERLTDQGLRSSMPKDTGVDVIEHSLPLTSGDTLKVDP
jgi:hypothetical protein